MEKIKTHIVPEGISSIRFSNYLLKIGEELFFTKPSRNFLKKLIKRGEIRIDGNISTTGTWIKTGQIIELYENEKKITKIFPLVMEVIYEDEHLAVINKPAGIVVSGNRFRTVENALLHNLKLSNLPDTLALPRPVHRLDALTSGLLLIAKTRSVRRSLGEMFSNKKISKIYRAIVIGKTPDKGIIDSSINDQLAVTEYSRIRTVHSLKCSWLSLLELKPLTGRTHQLRIHLSGLGFPILGDKLYGEKETLFRGKGLFLCAAGLKFQHPVTRKEIELRINEPNKFNIHLQREERRYFQLKTSTL